MNFKDVFRRNLRIHRAKEGLTQGELAKRVGMTRSLLASWETGRSLRHFEHLKKICKESKCSASELLGF